MSITILPEDWLSVPRILCGIMSGTSLDGIDVAIVQFNSNKNQKTTFQTIGSKTLPYTANIKNSIIDVITKSVKIEEVSFLNFALSKLYYNAIIELCTNIDFDYGKIDAIGMHGQTVWHEPNGKKFDDGMISSTLQLGSISALATLSRKTIVGDFRSADIALGGQGALFVPIFDYEFMKDDKENRIVLNIGGISNITLLPKGCTKDKVLAFDTGPGNVLIDYFMKLLFYKDFDEDGIIASSGTINELLLEKLKEVHFISQKPPKSTGRELFNSTLVNSILRNNESLNHFSNENFKEEDLITTLSFYTAWSIAENIRLFGIPDSSIIISGGGAKNKYILNSLQEELPKAKISISDEFGIPYDIKEAICFAYLAYRTLGNLTSNLPSVTGARSEAVLGVIAL